MSPGRCRERTLQAEGMVEVEALSRGGCSVLEALRRGLCMPGADWVTERWGGTEAGWVIPSRWPW